MRLGHGKRPGSGVKANINLGGPKFGQPTPTINIKTGGGLINTLVGSATSAAVGVASAAIVNKINENSQMKMQEKQAERQMLCQCSWCYRWTKMGWRIQRKFQPVCI